MLVIASLGLLVLLVLVLTLRAALTLRRRLLEGTGLALFATPALAWFDAARHGATLETALLSMGTEFLALLPAGVALSVLLRRLI